MLRRRLLLSMLLQVFVAVMAAAIACEAEQPSPGSVESVTLGRADMPLAGPWSFEPEDSPRVGGELLWAEPGFDDSAWNTLDLSRPAGASGDLPGWMERGYPRLNQGFAWYRLRVKINPASGPVWLKMPDYFDDAYEVYANGHLVGGAGFRAGGPVAFYSRAHSFALPPPDAHGIITLALRFWLDQNTRFDNPSAGGLHAAPLLGLAATIRTLQAKDDTALILNQVATGGFLPLFFLLSGAASLWAWLKARGETAYLWLAIRLFINVLGAAVYESAVAGLLSQNVATVLQGVIIRAVLAPCWIVFWWYWFDLRRSRWILRATAALTLLDFASALCARATVHGEIPLHWATWLSPTNTLIKFGELVLLAVIFAKGYRQDRTEALLALAPLAINEIDIFNGFSLEGRFGWDAPVLGMHIPPSAVASFVLVLTIAVLAVRRFLVVHSRELLAQQAIEAEMVQVSELQKRVLVPEVSQSPFFQIETAYLPAQAVGGDFFQVLTHPDDSTLIVLGDVSGKGVTAAFLVAVLIGAIRTRADESFDPLAMLHTLNARLIDRSEGHFATCLAMHIQPDGKLLLANAGHLPPYRNGVEIDVPGALPLGVVGVVDLSVVTLQLSPSDQLTLLSDGIVEAMNAKGELFGFERTRTVSRQSAQTIAAEARHFGQTDDITAVTVTFTGPGPINATALAGQHPGQAG